MKTADASFVTTTAQSIGLVGFTIVVTNTGPISTNATLSDQPLVAPAPSTPSGNAGTAALVWMIDPFGSDEGCTIVGTALSCNFGTFIPGAMKRVHITAATVARSSADSRNDNCGQRVDNIATVTIGDGSSRQSAHATVDVVCLPTTAAGALTITKYTDDNANGRRDTGEQALSGWTFEVRNMMTGQTQTVTTNSNGVAVVSDLEFGQYTIRETACASPCDFTKWLPISYTIGSAGAPVMNTKGSAQITIDAAQQSIAFGNRLPRLPSTSTEGELSDLPGLGGLVLAILVGAVLMLARGARRSALARR